MTERMARVVSWEDMPESRGTPIYIWKFASHPVVTFTASNFAERETIYVPAGWSLVSDASDGVVLSNVWGQRLTAAEAVERFGERSV